MIHLNYKNIFYYIIFSFICTSCASKEDILYFQDINEISEKSSIDKDILILPGDILNISLSSLNSESLKPFQNNFQVSQQSQIPTGYLVDSDGMIDFPILGELSLGGLAKREAISLLKKELSQYVVNPGVTLRISNFTVSVLGEVNNPGNFLIDKESLTIIEAISLAGDMTIFGNRKTVKVIRDENGLKNYGELDFTSINIVNSPYFHLKQNDVIIVSPNSARIQSSTSTRNVGLIASLVGLGLTIFSVLSR